MRGMKWKTVDLAMTQQGHWDTEGYLHVASFSESHGVHSRREHTGNSKSLSKVFSSNELSDNDRGVLLSSLEWKFALNTNYHTVVLNSAKRSQRTNTHAQKRSRMNLNDSASKLHGIPKRRTMLVSRTPTSCPAIRQVQTSDAVFFAHGGLTLAFGQKVCDFDWPLNPFSELSFAQGSHFIRKGTYCECFVDTPV